MKLNKIVLATVIVFPGTSFAGACDRILATDQLINCLGTEYQKADEHLNKVYKKIYHGLTETERKSLLEAQRNWIKQRDEKCEVEAAEVAGGQVYEPTYISCQKNLTTKRTKELQAKKW